jgi:ATPase subunit of ABC transporter with duplicated ATPase domains
MLSSAAQTAALASPQRTDATVATARAATAPAAPQQASADAPAPADELQRKLSLYREALLDVSVGSEAALDETLAQLRAVAAANGAGVTVMRLRGGGGADVLVRKLEGETQTELRIAVIGNVDAGKSTLISVLVAAQLDDGRGAARRKILHHPHEQETGRTSSISQHSMLFAADGASLTDATHRAAVSEELVNAASKIVTLVRPAAVASLRCRCDTMLSPTGRLVRPRALPAHNLLRADRAQTGLRPCHRRRQRWPGRQCAPRSVAACASRMC